ncbi:MAG TPA: ABC transporter permease [Candidatus Avidesulfovibrio excrementigallinarum]|nr:ABC transporter permease [Candidatus Avidesulfovibrio excrementigallinarum]
MASPVCVVMRLALADIRHEWRMSLCLVLAVAAIAAPLLLFFGLKYGTLETLRSRLLDNPSTLELTPVTERLLDEAWFARWRADPRVAFVVPHTRRLSAQADVRAKDGGAALRLDLRPTLPGDVLLTRYGIGDVPRDGCVLSSAAAERLKAQPGSRLVFTVTREQGRASASLELTVTGVLPVQAGVLACAYIPLDRLEAVEDYKDGRAVPELGWPGQDPVAHMLARGALLTFETPPDPMLQASLQLNTGFARLQRLDRVPALPALPGGPYVYRLSSPGRGAVEDNFLALEEKGRGWGMRCVPEFAPVELALPGGAVVRALPAAGGESAALVRAMEALAPQQAWLDRALRLPPRVMLVPASQPAGRHEVTASLPGHEDRRLRFSATLAPHPGIPEGVALLPQAMLGQLALLEERSLRDGSDSAGQPAFLLGRRGYSSFRMYAASMDDVAPLAADLERESMHITTQADRIEEIRRLDEGLSLLFWLIAAASFLGGTACLLSSIYASVERKRREFAVLRLLGLYGVRLGVFPLVSSLVLTLGGMVVGLGIFHAMSRTIGVFFAGSLAEGERVCALGLPEQALAVLIAAGLAVLAGGAAALRLSSIEPSESLRDE